NVEGVKQRVLEAEDDEPPRSRARAPRAVRRWRDRGPSRRGQSLAPRSLCRPRRVGSLVPLRLLEGVVKAERVLIALAILNLAVLFVELVFVTISGIGR